MTSAPRFERIEQVVISHYGRGEYDRALAVLERAGSQCAGQWERIAYWRACLLARRGLVEGAIDTLRQAVDAGAWWAPRLLETEADLDPLWDSDGYRHLLTVMEDRRRRWAPAAAGVYLQGVAGGWPYVGLHGRNQIFEIDAAHLADAMGKGWEVVLPESVQRIASDGPVWDDHGVARDQVMRLADSLFPDRRFTIGGFSQGARRALQIGLESGGRITGVLAVAPMLLRSREIAEVIESMGHPPWPLVSLVTGGDDPAAEGAEAVAGHLRDEGVEVMKHVAPQTGHGWIDPPREILVALAQRAGARRGDFSPPPR
ncbi:MAG TPA: hypothetical protein VHL52_10610 [Acidimicrobiia bacterium]|nr:hypothetical protein [Acidimicrobiia bacterium]